MPPNPLVIPPGYGQAIFSLLQPGPKNPISFSQGFKLGTTELALATNLNGWFIGNGAQQFGHILDSDFTALQVEVIGNATAAIVSVPTVGFTGGTNPTPNVCAKIYKKTGVRGKANKGAMFWPGILQDGEKTEAGGVSAAGVTRLATAILGLVTAMGLDGSTPYILHHALTSGAPAPTLMTGWFPSLFVATQRRRMNRR